MDLLLSLSSVSSLHFALQSWESLPRFTHPRRRVHHRSMLMGGRASHRNNFWCSGIKPSVLLPVSEALERWKALANRADPWKVFYEESLNLNILQSQNPGSGLDDYHFNSWSAPIPGFEHLFCSHCYGSCMLSRLKAPPVNSVQHRTQLCRTRPHSRNPCVNSDDHKYCLIGSTRDGYLHVTSTRAHEYSCLNTRESTSLHFQTA